MVPWITLVYIHPVLMKVVPIGVGAPGVHKGQVETEVDEEEKGGVHPMVETNRKACQEEVHENIQGIDPMEHHDDESQHIFR